MCLLRNKNISHCVTNGNVLINRYMRLEELFQDRYEGGYPEKKPPREKTKMSSKRLRKKADKANPERDDTAIDGPKARETDNEPSIPF